MSKPFSKHDLDPKGTLNIQRTSIQYVYKNRIGDQGVVICVPDGNSLAEWKVNSKVPYGMLVNLPVRKDSGGHRVKLSLCQGIRHY